MASTSETSFGAKLRNSQDLITYVSGFTNYNPPREQETVPAMSEFINSLVATNASESSLRENYKQAVDSRMAAFSQSTGSVEKLLSPIKGAIESQYGKKSTEAATINATIKKMRATKLTKSPADPTKATQEKTISQSERSYGSMTQFFNDIVNTLTQFPDYHPSSDPLKIASLQETATQLTTLNNNVAQKTQQLNSTRASRLGLYTELNDRAQRIKSYVKSQYGTLSPEYKLIKGLSI